MKQTKRTRLVSCFLAIVMVLCMLSGMAVSSVAAEDDVRSVATGVLKFNWLYDDDAYSRGSCFLINENTVVTAYHCTMFSKAELKMNGLSGAGTQELKKHMSYSVTVSRDVTIPATLINASEEMDFAIFELAQPIKNRTPLKIRSSNDVKAAETVYSVGFPANSDLKVINTYTSDDVTFKNGVVSKIQGIYQGYTFDLFEVNGYFLQTNCELSGGDSGGPMVDQNGNVVGVSVLGNDNYYLAAAIDQVTDVCDALGIKYTSWKESSEPVTDPNSEVTTEPVSDIKLNTSVLAGAIADAEKINDDEYTADSYKDLEEALAKAREAMDASDQSEIDSAAETLKNALKDLEEDKSFKLLPIIIIIAVVVVAIIAVVVVIVVSSKKKAKTNAQAQAAQAQAMQAQAAQAAQARAAQAQAAQAQAAQAQAAQAQAAATAAARNQPARNVAPPASNETTVLSAGAGETTVLSQNAGETTVLAQTVNGGSLVRSSNNERIPINSAEFTVGRERISVDYCVGGNSNISRVHARFVVRDGKTYIVDNKAANGTFVNGVKARAGQEIELKNGDKIVLADEEFKFKR